LSKEKSPEDGSEKTALHLNVVLCLEQKLYQVKVG